MYFYVKKKTVLEGDKVCRTVFQVREEASEGSRKEKQDEIVFAHFVNSVFIRSWKSSGEGFSLFPFLKPQSAPLTKKQAVTAANRVKSGFKNVNSNSPYQTPPRGRTECLIHRGWIWSVWQDKSSLFLQLTSTSRLCLFSSQVVAKKYRNYDIPSDMTGVWRYLKNAYTRDEFTNTCAADAEIETAYKDVARRLAK